MCGRRVEGAAGIEQTRAGNAKNDGQGHGHCRTTAQLAELPGLSGACNDGYEYGQTAYWLRGWHGAAKAPLH